MPNRRKFVKSLGAAAGLTGIAGCSSGGNGNGNSGNGGGDGSSITVPGLYDLSGATASVGRPTALGSQDALQWLADNDELQVEIDHPNQDYAYEIPEAVSAYESFTADDNPPAILGWGSGDTKALAPEVARDEIVYVSAAYAERLLSDQFPYNFFGTIDYTSQNRVLLKYLSENQSGVSVGLVGPNNDVTNDPMGGPLQDFAADLDLDFDEEPVYLPHTTSDATSQMQTITKRGWDVAIYHGIAAPYNVFLNARADVYPELDVLSTTWCVDESWLAETPDLYEGTMWVNGFKTLNEVLESGTEGGDAVESALNEFRDPEDPNVANLQYVRGFIHTLLLREGLHNAIEMDMDPSVGANVREGLIAIDDWDVWGLSEPFTFEENDRRPTMNGRIYEVADGQIEYQDTIELERNMEWIEYWNEEL